MSTSSSNRLPIPSVAGLFVLAAILLCSISFLSWQRCYSSVVAAEVQGSELDGELEHVLDVSSLKRRMAEDLVAGRVSLREAAATVLTLDTSLPRFPTDLRALQLGNDGLELEARQMIGRSIRLATGPMALFFTAACLVAEFDALFPNAKSGPFDLPCGPAISEDHLPAGWASHSR
jgi:hypothetical protein